jgi:hypothetical protein
MDNLYFDSYNLFIFHAIEEKGYTCSILEFCSSSLVLTGTNRMGSLYAWGRTSRTVFICFHLSLVIPFLSLVFAPLESSYLPLLLPSSPKNPGTFFHNYPAFDHISSFHPPRHCVVSGNQLACILLPYRYV